MKLDELIERKPGYIEREFKGRQQSEIDRLVFNAIRELRKEEVDAQAPSNRLIFPRDYDNRWHQACYVARYTYAYAREYLSLYQNMIDMGLHSDCVSVVSLGCGNMIDAWGLDEAFRRRGIEGTVCYTGVDKAKWLETYRTDTRFRKELIPDYAGRFLSQVKELDYDVFVFPKSIGDITERSPEDYERIKDAFRTKNLKEEFMIAFSIVKYTELREDVRDLHSAEEIIECLTDRGYKTIALRRNNSPSASKYPEVPELPESWKMEIGERTLKRPISNPGFDRWKIYKISKEIQSDT